MRIASGGVQHETNTFARVPTTRADFVRDSGLGDDFAGGEPITKRYRDTGTIHGGYLDGATANGVELVPLLVTKAQPAGLVEQAAFDEMLELFLDRLVAAGDIDGVALDLHGAMATDEHEDAEGAFIAAVRERVGPDRPVFVTLDLHANITHRMAEQSDCIIGYDTYPHVDMRDRGREAIELLARTIRGDVRPVQAFRQLPMMTMPPMQCDLREPMRSLIAQLHELESQPGILTATIAMGFPFADITDAGVSVLATADGDETLAGRTADTLAGWLWELRDELQPKLTPIEEAIRFTNDEADGLVLFADGSDNPGGGAPCDGTVALRAMIEADFQCGVVGVLCDPETVKQAHAAGVGTTIDARIGGKTDDRHGEPVETTAYIRTLCDGRFVHRGPMMQGLPDDLGPMAVLVVGGIEVVVSTQRRQLLDAEMLRIVGIAPETRRLIVVKSAVHFRADIGPLAAHIFDADTPGIHRPDFAAFNYLNVRGPIFPLDPDTTYGEPAV